MIRQMMKKTLLFLCVFMLGATGALEIGRASCRERV